MRKSTDSIQKRKDVDEDSDFCVLSTPSKGSCGNTSGAAGVGIGADDGAVSEEDSDDDWVVADVAETITATPEVVLEKFNGNNFLSFSFLLFNHFFFVKCLFWEIASKGKSGKKRVCMRETTYNWN